MMRIGIVLKLLLRQRLTWNNHEETYEENSAGNKIIERGIKSLAKQIEKIYVKLDQRQIFPDKKENINNELYQITKDDDISC